MDSSGGSVSDSVLSAVDDYVKEIKGQNGLSLNIRNLILRENWFCGSFQAAFVPLFRNSNAGTGYSGAPADINRNYSESEYTETGSQSGLMGNGINRYVETGLIPYQNSDLTLSDCRITIYSMSEGFETGRSGCRFDGVGFYLYPRYTNGSSYFNLNSTSESSTPVPSMLGYISVQRTNSQLNDVYYRNNLLTTIQNYSANYKPNIGFTVGAFNNGGTMNQFMNIRLGGYSIGKSLSPSQAAVHYNAVNRLMERLGRALTGTAVPEIRSELFTFNGSGLYANLRTRPGGFAQFEIQNSSGEPVEGFSFSDCPQITGDHFDHRVAWSGGSDVSQLVNTSVFLKVRLKNADLFTVQFKDQAEPIDSGAAGYKAGTAKQFFADTLLFRNSAGIIRMMHRAVKNPEPVLSPTASWEGNYIITTYSNVGYSKSVDQDRMVYKMWLRCVNSYGRVPVYYESVDGISWTRPIVELFKFNGSAENNILSDAPYPGGLYTVVDDSAYNQTDSTRRFKSVYNTHPTSADSRLNVSFSYDGLVWIPYSGNPVRYIGEDLSSCGWNPSLGKYLGYFRDSLGVRKIGRYLSNDWINWTYTGTILKAESYDIKGTQFYNMSVMYKDSVYWGIAGVLKLNSALEENPVNPTRTDNTVYLALLFSRDGINFIRCGNLTPLVSYGELGEWDDQMIYTAGIPVTIGNEYYIYYNGFNYKHYTNGAAPAPYGGVPKKSHIGLARIGVDRFISLTSY
ncbi:MAG: hypothetical protein K1X85_06050 [Ignavibacteria bacterium]|nr:hypothetical protein [Ignavibacteria bacterium]